MGHPIALCPKGKGKGGSANMADGDSQGMNLGGGVNGVDSKDGDDQQDQQDDNSNQQAGPQHGGDNGWGQPTWDDSWWYNDSIGWTTAGGANAVIPGWAYNQQGSAWPDARDGSMFGFSALVTDGRDQPVAPECKRRMPIHKIAACPNQQKDNRKVHFRKTGKGSAAKDSSRVLSVDKTEQDEFEWVEEEAIVDSGTVDNLGGPEHVDFEDVKETDFSKQGGRYLAASDDVIKNIGQGSMDAQDANGMPLNFTMQVGDRVKRILLSTRRAGEAGNMTIFNADLDAIKEIAKMSKVDENFIYSKKTKKYTRILYKDGLYKLPLWIKRRIRRGNDKVKGSLKAQASFSNSTSNVDGCKDEECQMCMSDMFDSTF